MKHLGRKLVACACALALTGSMAALAACGDNGGNDEIKIGVLVSDVSGEEAVAFRNYYTQYIAGQYNVTFTYTEQLNDSASEIAAIEQFAGQNYDAIISLSANDRASQAEACEEAGMYYAIASGMDDTIYETYKNNEYFVGQIGPSMSTEYEAGLAMGEYYADKIEDSVAVYGAFIPNPMHVYRMAGLLTGLGATYGGATGEAIVGAIFADSGVTASKISLEGKTVSYLAGFGDSTMTEMGTIIATDPDALLSVGMATTFFSAMLNEAGIPYADIDSFTTSNAANMETGTLEYLAGKYTSSIGPIFAAVYNAVQGNKIENADGSAISISQDYWVATSYEQFEVFQTSDSVTDPIYNKELLDTVIGEDVTYEAFEAFVTTDRTPQA